MTSPVGMCWDKESIGTPVSDSVSLGCPERRELDQNTVSVLCMWGAQAKCVLLACGADSGADIETLLLPRRGCPEEQGSRGKPTLGVLWAEWPPACSYAVCLRPSVSFSVSWGPPNFLDQTNSQGVGKEAGQAPSILVGSPTLTAPTHRGPDAYASCAHVCPDLGPGRAAGLSAADVCLRGTLFPGQQEAGGRAMRR